MFDLTFGFPKYEEMPESAFEGKSDKELRKIWEELLSQFWDIDSQYEENYIFSPYFEAAYRAARKPIEVSAERYIAAQFKFYERSTYEKQARVERERGQLVAA